LCNTRHRGALIILRSSTRLSRISSNTREVGRKLVSIVGIGLAAALAFAAYGQTQQATKAYQDSGHFPDGTVFVKEVFTTATAPMTTGTVSHVETLKG
jgi:hypothetical protein